MGDEERSRPRLDRYRFARNAATPPLFGVVLEMHGMEHQASKG